VPAVLIAVVLGAYLVNTRVSDLRESQTILGESLVHNLAPASEYGVFSGNRQVLERLLQSVVDDANVASAAIFDAENRLLARAEDRRAATSASAIGRLYPISPEDLLFSAVILAGQDEETEFDPLLYDGVGAPAGADAVIGRIEVVLSPDPVLQRQQEVLLRGMAIILVGLLLAALIASRAGMSLVRPLRELSGTFRRFQSGRLDARVPEHSLGEIGLLERGFNEMAEEVEKSRQRMEEQIAQATSELRQTLEAVEVQNVELDLARKRAIQANRLKSEFLANISHEIRTPMNAIFGYTQLLARTHLDQDQRDYAATIQRSAEVLLALLEDVLNLSRIEAGRVEIEEVPFRLEELIEDTIAMMAPTAYEKDLELVRDISPQLPSQVLGDPVKTRQILSNLLSNAVKFTEAGMVTIKVSVRSEIGDQVRVALEVSDTGEGIRDEDRQRLFDAFTQLDSSSSRRHQGAGLGLAIAKQLVRLLGGRMDLESVPGEGSRFSVELPFTALERIQPEPVLNDVVAFLYDDNPDSANAMSRLFRRWGAEVEQIPNLKALKRAIDQAGPLAPDSTLWVLCLDRGACTAPGPIVDACRELPDDARLLVLANEIDRDRLRRISAQLGAVCLAKTEPAAIIRERARRLLDFGAAGVAVTTPAGETVQKLEGVKVAVVEDNRINLRLVVEFLRAAGAETREAENGREALELLSQWTPDVVLMDIQLPEVDGLEVTRELRTRPAYRDVPILALTASASDDERRRCMAAGIDQVMVKPVREQYLVEGILRALEARPDRHAASGLSARESSVRDERATTKPLRPEIAEMVLADLPQQLDACRQFVEGNDWDGLKGEVHRMHGTAAFCGFPALKDIADRLETLIGEGKADADLVIDLYRTLASEVERVLEAIGESRDARAGKSKP
jgi:two-component system sensor histidine kinase BarA